MTGNELAEMTRKQPRIDVVGAARTGADDEIDVPSLVEIRNRIRMCGGHRQRRSEHCRRTPAREHLSSAVPTRLTASIGAFNARSWIWFLESSLHRSSPRGNGQPSIDQALRSPNIVSAL